MSAPKLIQLDVSGYMNSAKYSDLEVRCNDTTYMVHRMVLCPQIKFFDKACSLGFMEATEGVIDLSHDNAAAVASMLEYAYTSTYTTPEVQTSSPVPKACAQMLHHVNVYAIASKYEITVLKAIAKNRTRTFLHDMGKADWFADIVREVYESTHTSDRGLRDMMVSIAGDNHSSIIQQEGNSPLRAMMAEIPDFASDCFVHMSKLYDKDVKKFETVYVCYICEDKYTANGGEVPLSGFVELVERSCVGC
ncbi:hypothetical protein BU16DRAFT_526863, partial [Lophium mytilinum]